jgi:DNA-binding FrmR family transcriptional regulator
MTKASLHLSHPDIVTRLKRAEQHLHKTIAMIEAGRDCVDVARQLHAVKMAITHATHAFIHDHIEHYLELDVRFTRTAVHEFKEICRYL